MTTERKKIWGVFRDGNPYAIRIDREGARAQATEYVMGGHSKHEWRVKPVTVSWTTPKRKGK